MRRGKLNDELVELILANVRLKAMVYGDIMANITCNEVGGRLLLEFMDEYKLDDLAELSRAIIAQTERAMRERIAAIPDGVYRNAILVEGMDEPITLACAVSVVGDSVHIDLRRDGRPRSRAASTCRSATRAPSPILAQGGHDPGDPQQRGRRQPDLDLAPPGCILNALRPVSTGGRHMIGHFVAPLIFGALGQVLPERGAGRVAACCRS